MTNSHQNFSHRLTKREDDCMDMRYLKDMPIAILGAGAVGKTMAADLSLIHISEPTRPY